jgi:hypothetical protein
MVPDDVMIGRIVNRMRTAALPDPEPKVPAECSLLEHARQSSQPGVKGNRLNRKVGHAQKQRQDEHSVDPVSDGWPQFGHQPE